MLTECYSFINVVRVRVFRVRVRLVWSNPNPNPNPIFQLRFIITDSRARKISKSLLALRAGILQLLVAQNKCN